jgi:glycosyltransferase involved in cell wall biosynthesis
VAGEIISDRLPARMRNPLVSVIMPVYNVENYVGAAVGSVLNQTYGDFELLIVDDCSTDRSMEVVRSFDDQRIRNIRHDCNRGLAHARNSGISASRGSLLAFLDSDDVVVKDRLAKQTSFMHAHPDIALCAGWHRSMSRDGVVDPWENRITIDPDALNASLVFTNLFNASTIMMRRETVPDGGFRNVFAEDYEFLVRMALKYRLALLREVLAYYRQNPSGITGTTTMDKMLQDQWKARFVLLDLLGVAATTHYRDAHFSIINSRGNLDADEVKCLHQWFMTLVAANHRVRLFDPAAFERAASYIWFSRLYQASGSGFEAVKLLFSSTLGFRHSQPAMPRFKFLVKAMMHRPFRRADATDRFSSVPPA